MSLPGSQVDLPVVLLVEDNERSRIARSELFTLEGCRVIDVENLADALVVLNTAPRIDVVVTDINLSGRDTNRDGLVLARFVREKFQDLPLVAYTAFYGEDEIALEDQRLFDRWYPRGSLSSLSIASSVSQATELAEAHRRATER